MKARGVFLVLTALAGWGEVKGEYGIVVLGFCFWIPILSREQRSGGIWS